MRSYSDKATAHGRDGGTDKRLINTQKVLDALASRDSIARAKDAQRRERLAAGVDVETGRRLTTD